MNCVILLEKNILIRKDFSDPKRMIAAVNMEARFQVQSATPSPWVLASSKKTS